MSTETRLKLTELKYNTRIRSINSVDWDPNKSVDVLVTYGTNELLVRVGKTKGSLDLKNRLVEIHVENISLLPTVPVQPGVDHPQSVLQRLFEGPHIWSSLNTLLGHKRFQV